MTQDSPLASGPGILTRTPIAVDGQLPSDGSAWRSKRGRWKNARRIGLFGLFGSGNSGNDGSLEAMLTFVRQLRANAEVICICSALPGSSDRIAQALQVATITLGIPRPDGRLLRILDRLLLTVPRRVASLFRAIRCARTLDTLIIPGTGILDDFGEGPSGVPLTLFVWCLTARLCGARIAFVSIGAGPIHHPLSRWLMRSAVAMADYRSYRDTISKAFMESIGFDARADGVYPDLAFKLPAPSSPSRRGLNDRLVVGLGVMTYLGWRNDADSGEATYQSYLAKLTKIAIWLLDRGHAVRVLMGDAGDRRAVGDLLANLRAAQPNLPGDRLVFEPMSSLHDLMRQISETDVVVATRYHNVLCALKLGKPTVSIGYAEKNDVLMTEMGLSRFCQHVDRLNVDQLVDQFSQLIADRERYELSIANANRSCRQRLEQQDALLAARLL